MNTLASELSFPLLNQRYRLEQQIVSGIHSQVWKATDTLKGLPVLLKSYLPAALHDWKHIQLIEREARILSQINHIEIPGFVDFFTMGKESEQTLHLVTYWVNGMTLQDKLDTGWQISETELLALATHVLELLTYLHAFNPPLVHRDIKPSNLMVNEWGRVYLIDFGGAQEAMHATGTAGSTIVGTLGYMAAEQFYGRAVPASDLYSLGVTLLHLLKGKNFSPAVHEAEGVLQPHEDTLLTKSLKNFKAEPRVVLHDEMMKQIAELHPHTNKEYLEQKETLDQIRVKAAFIILALFSVIILIFVIPVLVAALAYDVQNGDYLGSVITLMSVFGVMYFVSLFIIDHRKTKAEQRDFIDRQQKGLLLPLSVSEPPDSDQINHEMLLKNNRLLLSDKGILLQNEGSKFIAWPQVQSATFTPALPDYAHWHKLMSDRFFYLALDYTEAQTSKTHVVLMALPAGDFSAIENAFCLLGEHYRKHETSVQ